MITRVVYEMGERVTIRTRIAAACAASVLVLLTANQATATPAPSASSDKLTAASKSYSRQENEKSRDFWTPERLAEGIRNGASAPATQDTRPKPSRVAADQSMPLSQPPQRPTIQPQTADTFTAMYKRTPTVGRLWYEDPSDATLHSCTATVINNGNKSTILTAAHCVHGGEG